MPAAHPPPAPGAPRPLLPVAELDPAVVSDLVPGRYLLHLHAMQYPTRAGRLLGRRLTSEGWSAYAERMMLEEFGEEYKAYMQRTGRFFPK